MNAETPKPAAALGYSITANVGDRRQIVVQCFVDEGESDEVVNGRIDRAMRVIDRQQAHYDLDAEMEGFHKVGASLAQMISQLPLAERSAAAAIVNLRAKLEGQREGRQQIFDDGYAEHAKIRKGAYEPRGAVLQRLNAADAAIEATEKEIAALPANTLQHKQEIQNSVLRFQDDLKKRRARVNHLRSLLGQEPVADYLEEEGFTVPLE